MLLITILCDSRCCFQYSLSGHTSSIDDPYHIVHYAHTLYILGVQADPSADNLVPPSTDLQLQSLSSSSATSPTNHDRLNRDNTTQMEEELSSSLAQLNLQDETEVTKRHDYAEKREGLREPSVDRGEQNGLTEFHHHEEKQNIDSKGKRDEATLAEEEGGQQRTGQYSAVSSGGMKGERTSAKLTGISEEKEEEESGDEVPEWRLSDVFSGLNNDSPKNHS